MQATKQKIDFEKNKEYRHYDPRVVVDKKKGDDVVWSSHSVKLARQAIKKGQKLKSSPFFDNKISLRKADIVFQYSQIEKKEIIKCKMSVEYFADNYGHLKTSSGIAKIKLRPYQRRMLRHLQANRLSIVLSSRQMGKTTTIGIFLTWFLLFHFDKTIGILGQKGTVGREIIGKIKEIMQPLPFFMKPGLFGWNNSSMSFDNGCIALTKTTTEDALQGLTIDFLFLDEFAYVKKNLADPFWENVYPTISANKSAKMAITSTPNGKNLFFKLYDAALKGVSNLKSLRIDWWEHPDRDEEWKENEILDLGSIDAFNQQYGLSFEKSSEQLLEFSTMRKLHKFNTDFVCREDIYQIDERYDKYLTWKPDYKHEFEEVSDYEGGTQRVLKDYLFINCDLAEGLGKDSDHTVAQIFKMTYEHGRIKFVHIGKFDTNLIRIKDFAIYMAKLTDTKFNQDKCKVLIEFNTYGGEFLAHHDNYEDHHINYETFVKYKRSEKSTLRGLRTNKAIKKTSVSSYKYLMEDGTLETTDKETIEQIDNFQENDNGTFSAQVGHDDLVMPFVNASYFLDNDTVQLNEWKDEFLEENGYDDEQQSSKYRVNKDEGLEYIQPMHEEDYSDLSASELAWDGAI